MKCPYKYQYLYYKSECSPRCRYRCDSGLCSLSSVGGMTLEEVAQHIHNSQRKDDTPLTRERIRQIEDIAIRKIKAAINHRWRNFTDNDFEQLLSAAKSLGGSAPANGYGDAYQLRTTVRFGEVYQ